MKKILIPILVVISVAGMSQTRQNPVVKEFGGVFDVPNATVKPDPSLQYHVVVDIMTATDKPEEVNPSLYFAARLMNLHAVGGVPKENLDVILVVHSESTYALMDNESYRKKYKTDNPNLALIQELRNGGARVVVCGQSLINRGVAADHLAPGVEIAVSMLTTVTMYQLKGYAYLKF
jgi:intracellular sulfur oxidation DsrE/DsrF family protein